jgi:hypothetical protein
MRHNHSPKCLHPVFKTASLPKKDLQMKGSFFENLWKKENWWSVWLGLCIVFVVIALWLDTFFKGWSAPSQNTDGYLTIFLVLGTIFCISIKIMGRKLKEFVPDFIILFIGSLTIFCLVSREFTKNINIEAPLPALIIGLIIFRSINVLLGIILSLLYLWFNEINIIGYEKIFLTYFKKRIPFIKSHAFMFLNE